LSELLLSTLVATLTAPAAGTGEFSATSIPQFPSHRVAIDEARKVCLLIAAAEDRSETPPLDIRMDVLEVRYSQACVIRTGSGIQVARQLTIVRCLTLDANLVHVFLNICEFVLGKLGATPSVAEVSSQFQQLSQLFRALALPATRSIQGVWGELLLIAVSSGSETLAKAWHQDPLERYDFAAGSDRIEVKTCAAPERSHHFSLEQLEAPLGSTLCIASIQVDKSGGGSSVSDLLQEVRTVVSSESYSHIYRTVVLTLGKSFSDSASVSFDRERAVASLRYYRPEDIPRISRPLPAGVSSVRFVSDLSTVRWISQEELQAQPLFSALYLPASSRA